MLLLNRLWPPNQCILAVRGHIETVWGLSLEDIGGALALVATQTPVNNVLGSLDQLQDAPQCVDRSIAATLLQDSHYQNLLGYVWLVMAGFNKH